MTRDELCKLQNEVHSNPDFSVYNSTNTRDSTNCYSHAIGARYPKLQLYRIGAISGKKPINESYESIGEILKLLLLDLDALNLEYDIVKEENLKIDLADNQHIIKLYVKIYPGNGKIGDFHFVRYDDNIGWTEKYRTLRERKVEEYYYEKMEMYYQYVVTLKITR